jgi:hypothetical protein
MFGFPARFLRGAARATLPCWVAMAFAGLPSTAAAVPELVSWTHSDTSQIVAFRLYVQTQFDPIADVIEIPLGGVDPNQSVFGHFITRDPSRYTWVSVVAVDAGGQESGAAWTKIFPPLGTAFTACYADFDGDGYVGITDMGMFKNAFGQTCAP